MSRHRRYRRRRTPESWSSDTSSMRASTTQTADDDVPGAGGHRQLKQPSSGSLSVSSPASNPSWVLLNRGGAQLGDFPSDRTTSAMSHTSQGTEISVSFELVEPPGISVLTLGKSSGDVITAHRDVVLLAITIPFRSFVDLFVYQASRDPSRRRRPSLLLLGGPMIFSNRTHEIGIMSCTSNDIVDDSPSFLVAELRMTTQGKSNVRVFRSGSGQWESFENLHIRGANGGRDDHLRWWSTDAVVPYGRRYMIWADYYRGMVVMDLSSQSDSETTNPPPRLRYVPLPVDRVGDPEDRHGRRGYPKASRSVCATRHGIKFVSVDTQHWSNFGVGNHHVLKWSQRFRITTWSLREDKYTWRKDATMHEGEFWDALDGRDRRFPFPHVQQPEFPVVNVDNPDVVSFRLENHDYCHRDEPKWMIEVDLRKKVLRAATAYSSKESDGDAEAIINSARVSHYDPIPSELPRYMDGGQAYQNGTQ